jgi:OOP family OmpA-OmpF porin
MLGRVIAVLLSSLCFTLPAAALPPEGGNFYVGLDAGASFVADSDISGGGLSGVASFDPGFNVGAAFGYRFLEHFRSELNTSYRRANVDKVTGGGETLIGAGDAGVFSAMVNGYFDWDLGIPVKPYIGVGIGVGVVMVDSDASANVLIVDDSTAEFAWNVMGGLSFEVVENVIISGGYRYFSTLDATLDATLVGFGSGSVDGEIGVHELIFGVRYEF